MSAKIIAITQPLIEDSEHLGYLSVEEFLAYVARVSNPSNQNNTLTAPKLLKYLIKNKHWSPFEMVNIVMEISTTRDIGRQILRHRSFSFQEFSQRYADPTKRENAFERKEARLQDSKNRQNSIETDNEELKNEWEFWQNDIIYRAKKVCEWAINEGIAKEQARAVLPEGLTLTKLYMQGSLRSWIHYCQLRMTEGTQKEHRKIAIECWNNVLEYFPT